MKPVLTEEIHLGRYIPDRTDLSLCAFCPMEGDLGLVTIPFVVYGEEQAKRIKPGYFIDRRGRVSRHVLAGLNPEATVFGYDERGFYLGWVDANRTTILAVDRHGRTLWRHRLRGYGCARRGPGGDIIVGSLSAELRRLDRTGALLGDFDPIFAGRPFAGPHGVDLDGPTTYLADPDTTHSIWAIDAMGNSRRRIGSDDVQANRSGKGLLCYPFDVLVLDTDSIWVAEHGRQRLSVFDDGGRRVGQVTASELAANEICTSRLHADWERRAVFVFGRRDREVWLLGFRA